MIIQNNWNAALYEDKHAFVADADAGMANWIQMFAIAYFTELSHQQQIQVIRKVEESLKSTLYQDKTWIADYRRIRIVAFKL